MSSAAPFSTSDSTLNGSSGTFLQDEVELVSQLIASLVYRNTFKSYGFQDLNVSEHKKNFSVAPQLQLVSLPDNSAQPQRRNLRVRSGRSKLGQKLLRLIMSAAVVAPSPIASLQDDASALARKRRREILASQRAVVPDLSLSNHHNHHSNNDSSSSSDDESCSKRRCMGKKPQMKYDPDVPMSREAAAVWRREQRRKRNRESAAASRQRQRDRIAELELEVQDFQEQYEKVMSKVQALEDLTNMTDDLIDSLPTVSPISTISSFSLTSTGKDLDMDATVVSDSESEKEPEHHHQYKMISRQA